MTTVSTNEETCRCDQDWIVRDIFNRIGDRWTLLVIRGLSTGTQRFTVLRAGVPGISQRMLTVTLRQLERDGLVQRTVHAEVPPRVEYELTPLGLALLPHIVAFAGWALEHEAEIRAHRDAFDGQGAA